MSEQEHAPPRTAREHAEHASTLLRGAIKHSEMLEGLDEMKRLELAVSGGINRLNRDLEFTVASATAHALTALALEGTYRSYGPLPHSEPGPIT